MTLRYLKRLCALLECYSWEMFYRCPECLQPDTRPNVRFQNERVCGPCSYASIKKKGGSYNEFDLDRILKQIDPEESFRLPKRTLLGVSGGKDSLKQALFLRNKLNIEPLLVCLSYPSEQVTDVGLANLANLVEHGFSIVNIYLPVKTWKNFMKQSFLKFGNFMKSSELALISSVPRYAIDNHIKIVFWGENPGLLNDDRGVLSENEWDGNTLARLNTLSDDPVDWIDMSGVERFKLEPYCFPTRQELADCGVQILFLSPFMQNWSLIDNGAYSGLHGLRFRDSYPEDCGDLYRVTSLDEDWVAINQMMKYYKYGFGRASDYMTQELRLKRIEVELGKRIIENYDGICSDNIVASFCEFLEISVQEFWQVVSRFTNSDLFDTSSALRPRKRF